MIKVTDFWLISYYIIKILFFEQWILLYILDDLANRAAIQHYSIGKSFPLLPYCEYFLTVFVKSN